MTDKELRKRLKKLTIAVIFIMILIVLLSIYTLGSSKAELSLYASSECVDHLQVLGINEEEFRQYLSIFGNLVDLTYSENQRTLNMATNFMEKMDASYEEQLNEAGRKTYDASHINAIVKEIKGAYMKENIADGKSYTYYSEENIYTQNEKIDRITYCTQIEDISKNGDEIEVTYCLAIMTNEQMAEYMTGQALEFETHRIKAIIMNNRDYEYSKYFVSTIEEI